MSTDAAKSPPRLKERLEAICIEMIDKGILFSEAVEQFENCFILEVLNRNKGHLQNSSKSLGIHRNTLTKRIARLRAKSQRRRGK